MLNPFKDNWSVAAPWAMLDEFVVNVQFIKETHYQTATSAYTTATLTLMTYPGPGLKLKLSALQAEAIVAAVQQASTFVWDDFDMVASSLSTDPNYTLHYRPVVQSISEQFAKRGL